MFGECGAGDILLQILAFFQGLSVDFFFDRLRHNRPQTGPIFFADLLQYPDMALPDHWVQRLKKLVRLYSIHDLLYRDQVASGKGNRGSNNRGSNHIIADRSPSDREHGDHLRGVVSDRIGIGVLIRKTKFGNTTFAEPVRYSRNQNGKVLRRLPALDTGPSVFLRECHHRTKQGGHPPSDLLPGLVGSGGRKTPPLRGTSCYLTAPAV